MLFDSFLSLSRERSFNEAGPQPITSAAISAWCNRERWSKHAERVLYETVRMLDPRYLNHLAGQAKAARDKAKTANARSRR